MSQLRCALVLVLILVLAAAALSCSPDPGALPIDAALHGPDGAARDLVTSEASSDLDIADARTDGGEEAGPLTDVGIDAASDAASDGPAAPDAGPPVFSHKALASTTDPGFFSLRSFNNQLLAGTYGSGKIYSSANAWATPVVDLKAGESVYVMQPFGAQLYANTENRGEIWRTANGTSWSKVFGGAYTAIGTGLAVYKGQLYAAYTTLNDNAGRIYRSSTGNPGSWSHVFGNKTQGSNVGLRELIVYNNVLYCLSYDWDGKIGGFYTSTNGTSWSWHPKLSKQRPIKAHVWKGYLWISTSPYTSKRVPPAGVYRWDGKALVKVFQDPARAIGTDLLDFDGALYFVDMVDWRATKGASALHRSPTGAPGSWKTVLTFPEPEAMDLAVHGGKLHVATRHEGGHGKVYRIEIQ